MYNSNYLNLIPISDVRLFQEILYLCRFLPAVGQERSLGTWPQGSDRYISPWWCHLITRAFANMFPVTVHDGKVRGVDHSWFLTASGHLIDMSPVGRIASPQLFVKGDGFEIFTAEFIEVDIRIERIVNHSMFKFALHTLHMKLLPHLEEARTEIGKAYSRHE